MVAYRRAFNYGQVQAPAGAVVNRNFHFQFVAFNSALAQYFRDLTIGEVIRGILPFLILLLIVLMLITYVPVLTMWLPQLVYGN